MRTRTAFRIGLSSNLRHAARIICVSENTRQDLHNLFTESKDKTTVIRLAPQSLPFCKDSDGRLLKRYGIEKPYLLAVATIEPRKNHCALFEAVRILRGKGYAYQLVCVGSIGWKSKTILDHPALQSNRQNIIITGPLEADVLGQLYRSADCFIYPSIYEGFGLPPLEALATGLPALVSRNSSLPEILGDAPCWLSARPDGEEIASAVMQLAGRAELRHRCIELGYSQIKGYNWERTAAETLSVYHDVV